MGDAFRVMRTAFETRDALDLEWAENLSKGGIFLPGSFELLYGEPVFVFVDLPFANASLDLEGRVAHCIPIGFEDSGGCAGVAIELFEDPEALRRRIEGVRGAPFDEAEPGAQAARLAARSIAEVRARVARPGTNAIEGHTRNLSLAGVLVAMAGDAVPPVGAEVVVCLVHARTREEGSIPGIVARHDFDAQGGICGIGVQFDDEAVREAATTAFLRRVKSSEHARRLGGVTGTIETLGLADLLMSFGQCVPHGRFSFSNEAQAATIQVVDGRLASVRVGAAEGIKGLVRLMDWPDGRFEFHAEVPPETGSPPLDVPIEMGLLEATRLLDESRRLGPSTLAPEARLILCDPALDPEDAADSKLAERILRAAAAGETVAALMGTTAEPDALIEQQARELEEQGLIRLSEGVDDAPTPTAPPARD